MSDFTTIAGPNVELINALARLMEAAKGTAGERGAAMLIELCAAPIRRVEKS